MEELLKALHTIQDTCKSYDDKGCVKCPLYSEASERCAVIDLHPNNWYINDKPLKLLL